MAKETLTKKRLQEVVLLAIKEVLTPEKAELAYDEWLDELKGSASFSVLGFVNSFSAKHGLVDAEKKKFKGAVYNRLFMGKNTQQTDKSETEPKTHSAELTTFVNVMKTLMSKANNNGKGFSDLFGSFSHFIESSDVPENIQNDVLNWMKHNDDVSAFDKMSLINMKNVVHVMYLVLCDELGPMKADTILSASVAEVNALPSSRRFSASKLL
ncbi:hypothetical protein MNBD_GAMMA06-324 [hydrothermal vent metagenome]|uniref:Uncharacterized protein n=1 Tax=hydrothermal vent metagenome TaxID=652676 RepID=A0A3B0WGV8_9ZZZZ